MIPEAAVEAAARAMYDSTAHDGDWDEMATDGERATGRSYARAALEAAAPHMLPTVWDEGHEEGWLNRTDGLTESEGRQRNPYRPTRG